MGKRMYRSIYSLPQHYIEMSGQLHVLATLPLGEEPPVSIG
jgi:hypothetical protein